MGFFLKFVGVFVMQKSFKRKISLPVLPDYELLEEYCPRTAGVNQVYELANVEEKSSVEDEFVFPENKDGITPFYQFTRNEVREINVATERVYGLLVDSLDFLFSDKYKHLIPKFYGKEWIEKYPEFVEYAIHTFKNNHESIYGRFDIAYDFEKGKVLKFYEGNLDTPTMYFDSVVMNNHLLERLGEGGSQYNLQYENLAKNVSRVLGLSENKIAFLFDSNITEDAITTELLFHAFNDNTSSLCMLSDINKLRYDWELNKPKFTLDDVVVNHIFALYPWEDMVYDFYAEFPNPLKEWKQWADHTRFFEPAWRFFVSNKGVWAWLTYLEEVLAKEDENVAAFIESYLDALEYVIPSYMEKPERLKNYVKKPLQGRMSNNVEFYIDDKLVHETEGYYANDDFIYQEYEPTTSADEGKSKAIVCSWLAPWINGEKLDMESSGIAVREFTGELLEVKKERFMPHIVTGVDLEEEIEPLKDFVNSLNSLGVIKLSSHSAQLYAVNTLASIQGMLRDTSESLMQYGSLNELVDESVSVPEFICCDTPITYKDLLQAVESLLADNFGSY